MSTPLERILTAHYYDVEWSKKHQGFRCVCGWLGEGHVKHVAELITEAGFIQVVAETNRQYRFNGDEHLEVWTDRDTYTQPGL